MSFNQRFGISLYSQADNLFFQWEYLWIQSILWATPSAAGPWPLLISPRSWILGILANRSRISGAVIWHAWCLRFGVLGPWDDPGVLGSTGKDTLRSRLGLSIDSQRFFVYRGPKVLYFHMSVFRFPLLINFGSESGCLGLETKRLASDVLQKSSFAEVGFLMNPEPICYDCWWPWDQFSWFLLPWRMVWHSMILELRSVCATPSGLQIGWFPGPCNNNCRIPETDSRDPETEIGSLKIKKSVHGTRDALEVGLQIIPRS